MFQKPRCLNWVTEIAANQVPLASYSDATSSASARLRCRLCCLPNCPSLTYHFSTATTRFIDGFARTLTLNTNKEPPRGPIRNRGFGARGVRDYRDRGHQETNPIPVPNYLHADRFKCRIGTCEAILNTEFGFGPTPIMVTGLMKSKGRWRAALPWNGSTAARGGDCAFAVRLVASSGRSVHRHAPERTPASNPDSGLWRSLASICFVLGGDDNGALHLTAVPELTFLDAMRSGNWLRL